MIIDECLTFYFAGSQTTAMAFSNMMMHFIQQPKLIKEVREDIKESIPMPFIRDNPKQK